ncbi:GGDEF domain-containing protein [Hydrogenophaga sp. OTU3427]|uniref:GGDEF domain-containing protein n=1 Tax=Hydrogenophaga sp. OTU3427 TaxID=3043856 RepID=UPI00313DF2D2
MKTTKAHKSLGDFSNEPAGRREIHFARATVLVSAVFFLVALPNARTPLAPFSAFIPIYVTALVICDLITAVLLFGQFRALRSLGLLVLAGAYLFTAAITSAYALIFPGLFAPAGLLGSGPQTSSAMYMFWHAGFPMLVMAYAMLTDLPPGVSATRAIKLGLSRYAILSTMTLVLLAVVGWTAFATVGHDFLPAMLDGHRTTRTGKLLLAGIWLLSLAALWMLWRKRPHSVLDVWLQVVMCVWLFDLALAAVLNTGRYDLGWYMGRIYGLLAACFLLIVLLSENARHYARLIDISAELKAANDTLWAISMQDGLTDLANRRAFDQYLQEQLAVATRHRRPLSLVFIDVDHFKDYNDRYGHQAGDECLRRIADALAASCQRPADLVARYGGEEFAIVLPDTDGVGARHMAEAARLAVTRLLIPHQTGSTGGHVSISSGAAVLQPGEGLGAEQLIKAADTALYRAKNSGRNAVVFGIVSSA